LVYIQDSKLFYSNWTLNPRDETAEWKLPQEVSGISQVGGIPALFVLNGTLHVICESADYGLI
jgi:1-phosphatidylinositol phosphodiesterase